MFHHRTQVAEARRRWFKPAAAVASVAFLAGASASSAVSATPTSLPVLAAPKTVAALTVGFDHWGPVKLGMTPSQAAHILGATVVVHGDVGNGCFAPAVAGPRGRMVFMVEGATWDGPIVRFDAFDTDNPTARTDRGVGIGSSSAQVKAAYPGRVKVSAHRFVPGAKNLEVLAGPGDPAGTAIVFETDKAGRVTAMRWGSRQQAEYIEGCV